MQVMESIDQASRNAVADAIAAEGALQVCRTERHGVGPMDFLESLPRHTGMRGLAIALPMALALWAMIGLLCWALLR
jgi:hypothetical protein